MDFSVDSLDLAPVDDDDDFFETSDKHSCSPLTGKPKRVDLVGSEDEENIESRSPAADSCSRDCRTPGEQTRRKEDVLVPEGVASSKWTEIDTSMKGNFHDQERSRFAMNSTRSAQTPNINSSKQDSPSNTSKCTSGENTSPPNSSCNLKDIDMEVSAHSSLNYLNLTPNRQSRIVKRSATPTTPINTFPRHKDVSVGGVDNSLSPWERWVIQKAHQDREKRENRRQSKV